jgi:4-amino-4-deoxy-L-arabinose transferase-like glycosyltransferase
MIRADFTAGDGRMRLAYHRILVLILICAAVLRLLFVDQPFVDFISWRQADDATIADNFFQGHLNIFLPEISWNGPGPNYVGYEFQLTTYLASLLYHPIGKVDWVGRGISVVFGVWGIFAFHNLTRRAFDKLTALVSCAVFAVMPGGIFVDRSFLPDPVMVSLVVTSFWMLLAYLQDQRPRYLVLAVVTGTLGLLTKISGLIVGLPIVYAILNLLPAGGAIRSRYLVRLITAAILVLIAVIGYYGWAIHVGHAYPPYLVAASHNWIWNAGFYSWLKAHYFWFEFSWNARWLWTLPLLGLALVGLLFPPAHRGRSGLQWLFHIWFLSGVIFYTFGAQELSINAWNLHIVDPALAGLAAQGLLVIGAMLGRLHLPLIGRVGVILIIVVMHGFEMRHLRAVYRAHAQQSYRLGVALARISQPSDLVITVANWTGDPVAIYYSQRRGWVFPPAWPGVDWTEDIVDESAAIQLFDRLRLNGAKWFGIVAEQTTKYHDTLPRLMAHIEITTELVDQNHDWSIYRILPLKPESRLNERRPGWNRSRRTVT